ncbi:MAG: rubrerythrin family protein [Methanosphaera sp.]|uniref:rubrerythrin n=1 Tax=Methanosphaera sp. TaxID=2666342 RepID=UPI0025EE6CF5|nr:rubrerythrin family protein [Methanosphaera sp.]MDD6535203.1 rubrerythrin family protein [Methanosphaera sp.]MDY3956523.1 rubrerythrin family protein [Methanosphaera sp.]
MSKTIKNLAHAFVGENLARNRYEVYAKVAAKEGYREIADIFMETSANEFQHAKVLFKMLSELGADLDAVDVPASVPLVYGTTLENLQAAINGETEEYEVMYPEAAKDAEEEGHTLYATKLRLIGDVEEHHKERYQKLADYIKEDKFFNRDEEVTWVCKKCGFVFKGEKPPEKCPICEHPQSYFKREEDQW